MSVNVGTAVGYLELDTSKFESGFRSAMSDLQSFNSQTATTRDKLTGLSSAMASVGSTLTKNVTLPIVGIGTAVVKTTTSFETSMSQVAAISGATSEELEALSNKAKEMGAKTKFSASESADALQYMALAGYTAEESISALPDVLNLAAAGGMDLAYASDMITDSQSALGLTFEEVTSLVNQMAKTASKSNTSVEQLGQAILTVGGTAKNLAGGTTELNTTLGILADNGIKGAKGGTALRNIILSLAAPTDKAAEEIEKLGLQVFDAEGKMRPMADIFRDLNGQLSELSQEQQLNALNNIFNKVDLKSVNALLGASGDQLSVISNALQESKISWDGAVASAQQRLNDLSITTKDVTDDIAGYILTIGQMGLSESEQIEELQNQLGITSDEAKAYFEISNAAISENSDRWTELSGYIEDAGKAAEEMADTMLDNLSGQLTILGSTIEGISIQFGEIMLPAIKSIVKGLQTFSTWVTNTSDKTKRIIVVVATVAAALGPLLLVGSKLITGFLRIQALLTTTGTTLAALTSPIGILIAAVAAFALAWTTNFAGIRDTVSNVMNTILSIITTIVDRIKFMWDTNWMGIQTTVKYALEAVEAIVETALGIIEGAVQIFSGIISGDWEAVWNGIKKIASSIWNGIKKLFSTFLNWIVDTLISIGAQLYVKAKNAFQRIKDGFKEKWEAIKEWFGKVKEDPVQAIKDIFDALYNAGKDALNSLWEGLKDAWKSIKEWFNSIGQWISDKLQFWKDSADSAQNTQKTMSNNSGKAEVQGYAKGLSYVPYDGFPAILHKGERVLTKDEANDYNSGKAFGSGNNTFNFYNPEALSPAEQARQFKKTMNDLLFNM